MISPHTIQRDGQRDDVELFWKLSLYYHRKFGKLLNEKKKHTKLLYSERNYRAIKC